MVGIGASAGGLEALKSLFAEMPPDINLAFIVVLHLDPSRESLVQELLAKSTSLPVEAAADRRRLEANHVYVIPPNRLLTIEDGAIRLQEPEDRRGLRGVIDLFFRSLAADRGDRSIAIVLSGTGTEGTLGGRAVKAEAGLVLAQAPETATQPGMPSSVIGSGVVDLVLAPEKMPAALVAYLDHAQLRRETAPADGDLATPEGLHSILSVLRARTRHDFRGYKKGTLQRRIERRMGLQQIASPSKYVEFLRTHPTEVDRLGNDLLIGVTSFFRDPAAFEELGAKVLAAAVDGRESEGPIRIWVPGCATGEEAYSIAIVLAEQIGAAQTPCPVQIFATDIDERALQTARNAIYPESVALDITPKRLQRFFTRENGRYQITKSVREMVTFAVQNLITDPPFSRLDLVSCRNVLIYLEPPLQEKLLGVFHFALNPGGALFLGSAEGVGALDELFMPVSKRRRIFRRLGSIKRPQLDLPAAYFAPDGRSAARPSSEPAGVLADQQLLAHFAPAAVVVRRNGHIVRFYGPMERYARLPTGEATLDLLTLVRDGLKPLVRAALHDAVRHNRQKVVEAAEAATDRRRAMIRVTVRPLQVPATVEPLWLLVFEEQPAISGGAAKRAGAVRPDLLRQLDAELRATKKEQQHLVEQLESSNEELKAANEEILSMNEELQSTNEELVTSKEELQSMNEELTTVNAQLQDKVQELTNLNDDLSNLLVSTDIVTVFLDTDYRVKRFTNAATGLLNLLPSDVGRPIKHITTNLTDVDLMADARQVLEGGGAVERDVRSLDDRQYLLRVLPYRTGATTPQGVVLTLVDVTTLKHIERELRDARERAGADLRRMTRLHDISTRLMGSDDLSALLGEIIDAALETTSADMGVVRLLVEPDTLEIAAQRGLEQSYIDHYHRVDGRMASAYSVRFDERIVVQDVHGDSGATIPPEAVSILDVARVQAFQSTPLRCRSGRLLGTLSTHFRSPHPFDEAELRWLDLLARQAGDLISRRQAQDQLMKAQSDLEKRVADRTKWLTLMHDVTRAINDASSWDEGLQLVLLRICEVEQWQIGYVYLPDRENPHYITPMIGYLADERFRPFHLLSSHRRYIKGQNLPARVFVEGTPVWVNDREDLAAQLPVRGDAARLAGLQAAVALPIRFGPDVIAVLELFSDRPHERNDVLADLMTDVSAQMGKVLERERSTAEMADLVWREQQGLLHTLHDSLGQTLTGLGMLSAGLGQRVAAIDHAAAETAQLVAQQAQAALDQVRRLSRGILPVDIDPDGLLPALQELASTTEVLHKLDVQLHTDISASVRDSRVATQLYRIAQEGVTNAVKHACGRTVRIELTAATGVAKLRIIDDGIGIPAEALTHDGMGLRIMRYRATSIGASLSIEPGPGGGTIVSCVLRDTPATAATRPA